VKRIRFIKRAQALGFTLEDVAGLLQLNDTDACAKTRHLAARKLTLIEERIAELATMRDALAKLVGQCDRKLKRSVCPIIEILQWDSRVDPFANASSHHRNPSRKAALLRLRESQAVSFFERKTRDASGAEIGKNRPFRACVLLTPPTISRRNLLKWADDGTRRS